MHAPGRDRLGRAGGAESAGIFIGTHVRAAGIILGLEGQT